MAEETVSASHTPEVFILNEKECMLTTIDNPWNPFTNWDEWFSYDISHGYNTCGYLARIARTSNELSDADNRVEINFAIDWIVKNDPMQIYKKVYKD